MTKSIEIMTGILYRGYAGNQWLVKDDGSVLIQVSEHAPWVTSKMTHQELDESSFTELVGRRRVKK